MSYTKMLSLRFPPSAVNEPIIANLIRKFELNCNILKATIYPRKEGMAVMEVSGHRENFRKGLRYLKGLGIKVELDSSKIEGYVIRIANSFGFKDFRFCVGKYVREDHVKTTQHWMLGQPMTPNKTVKT